VPHLADGANILFVASAVEDPERKPAATFGFRGGRYISAEASARGEWLAGGSKFTWQNSYATSKQCNLATALVLAQETPRLNFNAIEPGLTPTTGLGSDGNFFVDILVKVFMPVLVPILMPFIKILSTPEKAARVITKIMTDRSPRTGVYYDETGNQKTPSMLVRDPKFSERVVAETRAFLATAARPAKV